MVEDYGKDSEATALADLYDWYFLPVINADGYVYTWTHDRLWRKSRKPNPESEDCVGVDLNRNFDFMWKSEFYISILDVVDKVKSVKKTVRSVE